MSSVGIHRELLRHLSWLIIVTGVAACVSSPQLTNQYLDPETGVTVTASHMPVVLYRENPSLAAYARNYLELGPIEVNRMGSYEYYLWVGIWNTMETTEAPGQRDGFDAITIFADSEPLMLELAGWTPDAIGTSRPVYLKSVASAADAYYLVTVDQINLIARAHDLRVRTTGATPREYHLWDGQRAAYRSFETFLKAALP